MQRIAIATFALGILASCSDPSSGGNDDGSGNTGTEGDDGDGDGDGAGDSGDTGTGDDGDDGACEVTPPAIGHDPGDDPNEPLPAPKPVAQADERALPVTQWMTAHVANPDNDPVLEAIHDDTFEVPPAGEAYGVTWEQTAIGPNGELPVPPSGDYIYAAAEVDVPDGAYVFARADSARGVFTNNGNEQPGDVYHLGTFRVPLVTQPGSNVVVVQATKGRYGPETEIELFQTTNELVLNTRETIVPEYPSGDDSVQYIGLPVLNVTDHTALDVNARVLESDHFEETVVVYPGLGSGATTHVALELRPKGPLPSGQSIPTRVRIEPVWFEHSYEATIQVQTVSASVQYRRTRRSDVDGSVQYYSVVPPASFDPSREYGMIVSLHGHGATADGNAAWHAPRNWAYIVAPTNRHRGAFNWETFGRLDGLEATRHAASTFSIDATRIHLTGHSMGGHGTWHAGALWPDEFGMLAPCAAWISYATYSSLPLSDGILGRATAASDTLMFLENLADKPVYMVHGTGDIEVPFWQSQQMYDELVDLTDQLWLHAEPDAGHVWDDPSTPGRDAVAYPGMYAEMENARRDPTPLDFTFVSASPGINPTRSFVTIQSQLDVMANSRVSSSVSGDTVTVETENVRSLELDGEALQALGITKVLIDGTEVAVDGAPIWVGPTDGKNVTVHGPLHQVMERPWCFVYDGDGPHEYREVAAFLSSLWSERGKGLTCTIPRSRLDDSIRENYNIIYMGVPSADICELPDSLDVEFGPDENLILGQPFEGSAMALVFPGQHDRLAAAWSAVEGAENLLFQYRPFYPRSELPDLSLWNESGSQLVGFFSPTWEVDEDLMEFVH